MNDDADILEAGREGVGVVDRNEDGGFRPSVRRGSLRAPGPRVAPYDVDRGAKEGVVERGRENGTLCRGRVGVRNESRPKFCRWDAPPINDSSEVEDVKEGTTSSDRVPFGGGLRTGIRLPGTDIREPDVTELELGVGDLGAGGLGPKVLSRREDGGWYMVGTVGTGGGRVPTSQRGLSAATPKETIDDCLLIVLELSGTGLRERTRDNPGLGSTAKAASGFRRPFEVA